jgi:tetratricopeptide (TPR) repeat protein
MASQYDAAIKDLSRAIKLDPAYAHAYASRGAAYYEKDQAGKAIADLEKAISLDPGYTWAKNVLREIKGGGNVAMSFYSGLAG